MTLPSVTDVGLRVDLDTFRGTRYGAPRLLKTFAKYGINASFFFSVGPDNMGRHVWRLLKPQFFAKMLRSNAANLYGWDILLRGTFWPGPNIGQRLAAVIREVAQNGHEIGLHAWDHHAWQRHSERWSVTQQRLQTERRLNLLSEIIGRPVDCSAVAGWRCDQQTIAAKQMLGLRYNSDCLGHRLFRPRLADSAAGTPQIPVTLPTYDEVIGRNSTGFSYNDYILAGIKPDQLNVYTVHAEVEGMAMNAKFEQLLSTAAQRRIRFAPLGALLPNNLDNLPLDTVVRAPTPGREGWVGWQASALIDVS